MNEILPNGVYITKEVMKLVRIGEMKLLDKVRKGEIVASKSGNKYVYLGKDLLSYIESNKVIQ